MVSILAGPLWLIFPPLAGLRYGQLALSRRWKWAIACMVLSPMALSLTRGVIEYTRGTATIEGMGLMHGPSNVDPVLRIQYRSGGCLVSGNEWLTQDFHHLGVEWIA